MRHLSAFCLFLGFLLLIGRPARAQGPTVDPTFVYGGIFGPGAVQQAFRQADGRTLLLGRFQRVLGQSTGHFVRLEPSGTQVDQAFQVNIAGLQGQLDHFVLRPNGKILLLDDAVYGGLTSNMLSLGAVSRQALLQLNADGTPDASFDARLSSAAILQQAIPQPDGKLLLLGNFRQFSGQSGPAIIRLNADGTPDISFQAAVFMTGNTPVVPNFAALQSDGKVVAAGSFDATDGQPRQGVARLLPTGTLDPSFQSSLPSGVNGVSVAVLPGNYLLLTCASIIQSSPSIRRLLPSGANDPSFQYSGPPLNFTAYQNLPPVVQPDGSILVATRSIEFAGVTTGRLLRFTGNGSLDTSFNNTGAASGKLGSAAFSPYPGSLQLLPNGQILLSTGPSASDLFRYAPFATSLPVGVVLLNTNGTRDSSFDPNVKDFGSVSDMILQPNGTIIIGGYFSEVNGTAVRNVARLYSNGIVDTSFSTTTDDVVQALALQPDGKLVLGGHFDYLNGVVQPVLGRVLTSGANDPVFSSPFNNGFTATQYNVERLILRPTGEILASGTFPVQQGGVTLYQRVVQVQTNGQEDTAFGVAQPSMYPRSMMLQPNGKLVVAGLLPTGIMLSPIWRLLPTGALDTGFAMPASTNPNTGDALAQDGAGRIYLSGDFNDLGAPGNRNLARFFADGQPDPSFQAVLPGYDPAAYTIAVQPNGRVLLGGRLAPAATANPEGTLRLLPNDAPDASYNPALGPVGAGNYSGDVNRILIQPDGAILAAGIFTQVGSLPINGLVRLLDAHVLAVGPHPAAPTTAAWPVPAHGVLHLALEAAACPQRVELLDALGRPVLAQAVAQQSELSLNTAGLPPSVYLLRVHYAQGGAVTRRVVLE